MYSPHFCTHLPFQGRLDWVIERSFMIPCATWHAGGARFSNYRCGPPGQQSRLHQERSNSVGTSQGRGVLRCGVGVTIDAAAGIEHIFRSLLEHHHALLPAGLWRSVCRRFLSYVRKLGPDLVNGEVQPRARSEDSSSSGVNCAGEVHEEASGESFGPMNWSLLCELVIVTVEDLMGVLDEPRSSLAVRTFVLLLYKSPFAVAEDALPQCFTRIRLSLRTCFLHVRWQWTTLINGY
jgi:hypothetical protein